MSKVLSAVVLIILGVSVGFAESSAASSSTNSATVEGTNSTVSNITAKTADLNFQFLQEVKVNTGVLALFLGDRYIGHLEDLKQAAYRKPVVKGYPISIQDYYKTNNMATINSETNGKVLLTILLYSDTRMFRDKKDFDEDFSLIEKKIISKELPNLGDKADLPNFLDIKFSVRLMYQEILDLDSALAQDFKFVPEGMMIGTAGNLKLVRKK